MSLNEYVDAVLIRGDCESLSNIPTHRLEESLTSIDPHRKSITFTMYTKDGMRLTELTKEQVQTELAVRRWRGNCS